MRFCHFHLILHFVLNFMDLSLIFLDFFLNLNSLSLFSSLLHPFLIVHHHHLFLFIVICFHSFSFFSFILFFSLFFPFIYSFIVFSLFFFCIVHCFSFYCYY